MGQGVMESFTVKFTCGIDSDDPEWILLQYTMADGTQSPEAIHFSSEENFRSAFIEAGIYLLEAKRPDPDKNIW